mgnify:CR=1 FL=1
MDIKKYISSGILENYILGLASTEERLEVEKNILLYPELAVELNTIERALELFATSIRVKTPSGMEASIMQRLGFPTEPTPVIEKSKPSNFEKYLFAGLVLIIASLLCFWFYNQNRNTSNQLEELNSEYTTLKTDCDTQSKNLEQLQNQLQIMREAGNLKVQMNGTDKAPDAIASVIYNTTTEKSYLDILHLPTPAADKQYQLWAIVDGKPVDMGVFDVALNKDTILQEVPFIKNPQAFAVTLEKKGGNPTPTLEEMMVVGNVVSG